jgi:hypothetical protein
VIGIVAHDAGGAEILSSYVKRSKQEFNYCLEGPAIKIFKNKLGEIENKPIDILLEDSLKILCGTSWQSDLEISAIIKSKELNKKTASFLDHWVNYKDRFLFNNKYIFPDEIWVGDLDAKKLAEEIFHNIPIVYEPNPYFLDIQDKIKFIKQNSNINSHDNHVLYVCEPIKDHAKLHYGNERYWGYTEDDAIKYFFKNIRKVKKDIEKVIIRPHPSENINKYKWVEKLSSIKVDFDCKTPLIEQISKVSTIVGCQSMAMFIGILAEKNIYSSIPPQGGYCSLPQKQIKHIKSL